MSTGRQSFGIEALDRHLGGGLSPRHVDGGGRGDRGRQDPTGAALGQRRLARRGTPRRALRLDESRRFPESRAVCFAPLRLVAGRLPGDARARFRAGLGFHATDRRLLSSDRSGRPPRDPGGPRGRAVARMEDRSLAVAPLGYGLLLSAFRPRSAPRRLRRARAGRAIQRIDPVRVLRVHLPPRPAQGRRMGRPRVAARELSSATSKRC